MNYCSVCKELGQVPDVALRVVGSRFFCKAHTPEANIAAKKATNESQSIYSAEHYRFETYEAHKRIQEHGKRNQGGVRA